MEVLWAETWMLEARRNISRSFVGLVFGRWGPPLDAPDTQLGSHWKGSYGGRKGTSSDSFDKAMKKSPYPELHKGPGRWGGGRNICYWFIGKKEKKRQNNLGLGSSGQKFWHAVSTQLWSLWLFPGVKHMLTLTADSTALLGRVLSYRLTLLMVAINIRSGLEVKFQGRMWVYHMI